MLLKARLEKLGFGRQVGMLALLFLAVALLISPVAPYLSGHSWIGPDVGATHTEVSSDDHRMLTSHGDAAAGEMHLHGLVDCANTLCSTGSLTPSPNMQFQEPTYVLLEPRVGQDLVLRSLYLDSDSPVPRLDSVVL